MEGEGGGEKISETTDTARPTPPEPRRREDEGAGEEVQIPS